MTRRRHPAFWPLAVLFAIACVWWTSFIPPRRGSLFRAIPASATVVTAHKNLAARWDAVSANPVTRSLLGALGLDADTINKSKNDKTFHDWLARLASDDVVFAYVPELGPGGEPAWVFASWLGGRSQRLRWLLSAGRLPGFRKAYNRAGQHVWLVDRNAFKMKSRDVISFSLVEGMLVGTISRSVATMSDVLACYEGDRRAIAQRPGSSGPDRGWISPGVTFEILDLKPNAIKGSVRGPWNWPAGADAVADTATQGLEELLGDAPLAFTVIQRSLAVAWLQETVKGSWLEAVDWLNEQASDSLLLCLLGGDLSGRLKGIKLPTLLAGVPVDDDAKTLASVSDRFDELNARQRWGLVPEEIIAGSHRIYAIESTADTWYAGCAGSERVAYMAENNWLLFSSNVEGLTNLLQRAHGGSSSLEGHAPAYGWFNLEEGGKALRVAITAWSLKRTLEDPAGSQAIRQKLNEVKAWIDSLAPLKTLRFEAKPANTGTDINFEAGLPTD